MLKLRAFSIIFVLSCITILPWFGDSALAGGPAPRLDCELTIKKVAPDGGDTEFTFEVSVDGGETFTDTLLDGGSAGGPFSSDVTVIELPLGGWALQNIDCEGDTGISFHISDDGFRAVCNSQASFATCTFFNERVVSNIPTLSEWGMIAAAAGLGIVGVFFALKRRKAQIGI